VKKITLVRHAKSSWKYPGLADNDRPLNRRGQKDAATMAARLAAGGFAPQRIHSSPALRAIRTAEKLAEAVDESTRRLQIHRLIYEADANQLIEHIQSLDDEDGWVVIVGHNPEMTDLVRWLSGTAIDNVPTCGVAQLHYAVDRWQQIDPAVAPEYFHFDYPKRIG
jgi:phosphohistidine phosphatase